MPTQSIKSKVQDLIFWFGMEGIIDDDPIISDEEVISSLALFSSVRYITKRLPINKETEWWSTVVPEYNETTFKLLFRMSRDSLQYLSNIIADNPVFNETKEPIPLQLGVALYRFGSYGNAASVKNVAMKFGISEGSVINITERVVAAITSNCSGFIRWPSQRERIHIGDTMATHLLPKCVGFVDGTDIVLSEPPLEDKDAYWSRKKKYCIQAQFICDHNKVIRDLFIGYPGSVHDAKVFSVCPIGMHPEAFLTDGEYLIGDSAYSLTDDMIVPYRRTQTGLDADKRKFNMHLSSQRVKVEHTIGIFKSRFQSLKGIRIRVNKSTGHKRVCEWVHACAILHNILIQVDPWEDICEIEENQIVSENITESGVQFQKREVLFELYKSLS